MGKLLCCILVFVTGFIGACSSNHSSNDSILGAGYYDKKLGEGIYLVIVTGRGDFFDSKEGLEETWRIRSGTLCGQQGYKLLEYKQYFEKNPHGGSSAYLNGAVYSFGGGTIPKYRGIIYCEKNQYSKEQVMTIVDEIYSYRPKKQAIDWGNQSCDSKKQAMDRGKKYFQNREYKKSIACFRLVAKNHGILKSQSTSTEQIDIHRAQYLIGYMLENGLGISKNLQAARQWYSKSALGGNVSAINRLRELKIQK